MQKRVNLNNLQTSHNVCMISVNIMKDDNWLFEVNEHFFHYCSITGNYTYFKWIAPLSN